MISKPSPARHIDRRELYTSLESRILYLHTFLDFSSRDIEALILSAKYIRQLIPAVVNIVYKKLLQHDITARAFQTRSTSDERPLTEDLSEDSPQILHRKSFLKAYLQKLCSDPTRFEFWEYLDKVGMMHVGLGRQHPLHVEYVHIGAALAFIQDIFTEAILSHPKIPLSKKTAIVKALGKVIWIQNDLFAKWYVRDGEEFTTSKEVVIEKEGYLHGVKVLDDDSEDASEGSDGLSGDTALDTQQSAAACPFTAMATGPGDTN